MPKPQGTTMTTLYDLGKADVSAFDDFRASRGLAPYFHLGTTGSIVEYHYGPFLDLADLDELDRAFLLGAQARTQEGMRVPWPYSSFVDHPHRVAIQECFESYTLWPNSHILLPAQHSLVAFLREVLMSCETELSLH